MRSLIPWSSIDLRPLGSLAGLHQDMDRFFGNLRPNGGPAVAWVPRLDWRETDDALVVSAELPGVDPEALDLTVMGDVLTISGEKRDLVEREEGSQTYSERSYGAFRRDVQLPCAVSSEGVRAECKNGILTVTLPKSEADRPRKIDVHVG